MELLIKPGRTVCHDNWFTSVNHAKGLHLDVNESVAIFDHTNKINVVYKKVKSTKHVALLTTIHNSFTDVEGQKTKAHMYYNASKGGVDSFDNMCAMSSTNRWPLCNFFGLLNICMNNVWIIHHYQPETCRHEKTDFLQDMAYNLCRPFAAARYQESG